MSAIKKKLIIVPTKEERMEMNSAIDNLIGNWFHDEERHFLESFDFEDEEDEEDRKELFCVGGHCHNYYDLVVLMYKGNIDKIKKHLEDLYIKHYGNNA